MGYSRGATCVLLCTALAGCGESVEPCAAGEELGPDGRCRSQASACPDGTVADDGGCVPVGCAPGSWIGDDGSCLAAGVQRVCAPGTLPDLDGVCSDAGVPQAACPDGFVAADGACRGVVPEELCADGLMAVPGESACRPIVGCGAGTWGDIPVEADTEYVDGSFGGASDGSSEAPWTSLQDAVDVATPGAIVAVAEGEYEPVRIETQKAVRLWGAVRRRW